MLNRISIVLIVLSFIIVLPESASAQEVQHEKTAVDHNQPLYACPAVVMVPGSSAPVAVGEFITNQPVPMAGEASSVAAAPSAVTTTAATPPMTNSYYTPQQGLLMSSEWAGANINVTPAPGGC